MNTWIVVLIVASVLITLGISLFAAIRFIQNRNANAKKAVVVATPSMQVLDKSDQTSFKAGEQLLIPSRPLGINMTPRELLAVPTPMLQKPIATTAQTQTDLGVKTMQVNAPSAAVPAPACPSNRKVIMRNTPTDGFRDVRVIARPIANRTGMSSGNMPEAVKAVLNATVSLFPPTS